MLSLVFLNRMHNSMNSVWMWLRKQKCALTNDSVEVVSFTRETKLASEHECLYIQTKTVNTVRYFTCQFIQECLIFRSDVFVTLNLISINTCGIHTEIESCALPKERVVLTRLHLASCYVLPSDNKKLSCIISLDSNKIHILKN